MLDRALDSSYNGGNPRNGLSRNLPVDEIEANNIACEIIANPPLQGFLTISNALQWRLQYRRVIECADREEGITAIYQTNL